MVAMSRVLARVSASETFSEELKNLLTQQVGSTDSTAFAGLDVFAFADKLQESGALVDNSQIDAVAEHLRAEMLRLGVLIQGQSSPQTTTFPTSLKLEVDKTPQTMNLLEILKVLALSPSDSELKQELLGRKLVLQAKSKVGLRFCFKTEAGLDADKTARFLNFLAGEKPVPRKFEGSFAVPLESALGLVSIIWFNPLIQGEKLYEGIDLEKDLDWNTVPELHREAVFYARTTRHKNFPQNPDIWAEFDAIVSGSGRWKNIIEDYNQHLSEGGQKCPIIFTEGVEEVVSALHEIFHDAKRDGGATRNPSGTCSGNVFTFSDLQTFSTGNVKSGVSRKDVSDCIVSSISSNVGDIRCTNVICIGAINVGVGDINGTIYCSLRQQPNEGVGDFNANLIRLSDNELVAKAIELGLMKR